MGRQVLVLVVLLCLMNKSMAQPQLLDEYANMTQTALTKPGCPYKCGGTELDRYNDVIIPYPFGIGPDCSLDHTFLITCNFSNNPPRPVLNGTALEVLSISLIDGRITLKDPAVTYSTSSVNLPNNYFAYLNSNEVAFDWSINGNCFNYHGLIPQDNSCSADSDCKDSITQFYCTCRSGYAGNPYLVDGCQDINECDQIKTKEECKGGCMNLPGSFTCTKGDVDEDQVDAYQRIKKRLGLGTVVIVLITIFLILILWLVYVKIKRRYKIAREKKFFKQNGGLLLQKQLSSGEEGNHEKSKLFTSKELKKATDGYNENRILGRGGQGTVYKGMLVDGRIVAVKKSTKIDADQVDQFINEVAILSQINHRNIVKLHGCCLGTEVPLLVYEFIPNGTLFDYIHNENEDFPLSWDVRLRIATEVASALSYLHSAASVPIYHRDIKSANILLDEKYKAKVADFGTSRSIAIDQTHLTTIVSGTFGYLDPEYFQSSQFTDKSDVYSFGVVLVELLTGQKPYPSIRSEESRSLTTYFMVALKDNSLYDILDARIQKDGDKEEIIKFANLAQRCLNLSGRKRPTMREVAMELERIRRPNGKSININEPDEEEYDTIELNRPFEIAASTSSVYSDVHPLIFEKSDRSS